MPEKTILLITGGNTGLGLETVKQLLQSSWAYHILLGGRDITKAETAIANLRKEFTETNSSLEAIQVDVESDDSIQKAYETVKKGWGRVDVLINNAGAGFDNEIASGTMTEREAWNKTYDINVSGTHVMTSTFVPLLLSSSAPRILFITSGTSTLTGVSNAIASGGGINQHIPPSGWPKPSGRSFTSYQCSKTALNMLILNWSRILKEDGVKVFGVSPGFLATGLAGVGAEALKRLGALDPSIGGRIVASVAEGAKDADAGKIVSGRGIQDW